ncbi:MAG TPA: hypothetical protein VHP99_13565 [Pyrinomonadaceae bacterium]|nr:hypothetical protein [Pyrinomonadaceae bacterium]
MRARGLAFVISAAMVSTICVSGWIPVEPEALVDRSAHADGADSVNLIASSALAFLVVHSVCTQIMSASDSHPVKWTAPE